jgi:hypothetical protein
MVYSTVQTPTEKSPVVVGILDPDYGDTITGEIMIRAMIYHSHPNYQTPPKWDYAILVLLNGTEIGTSVPHEWDSASVEDDLWNITVLVTDSEGNVGSDKVTIYVLNNPSPTPSTPRARVYRIEDMNFINLDGTKFTLMGKTMILQIVSI